VRSITASTTSAATSSSCFSTAASSCLTSTRAACHADQWTEHVPCAGPGPYARNRRLSDAVRQWALGSLRGSPGARSYYDALRARKIGHEAALRQLGNRLVGILHGCLKTHTLYDETTAWAHWSTIAA
jgi:hypothetical protein